MSKLNLDQLCQLRPLLSRCGLQLGPAFITEDRNIAGGAEDDGCWRDSRKGAFEPTSANGKTADVKVKDPIALGHETAGLVVAGTSPSPLPPLIRLAKPRHALGPKISHHKKGYRVAHEPGEIYRTRYDCKVGKSELWPSVQFAGILIS
ncbi:hypothetical protein BT69DRAFT_1349413 [Atractiella rhizophila]|nr:hypothetical protein BT69DRAFT_1349413 [Atractiella rhizophila]